MILALDLGQHIGWVKGAGAVGPMERGTFEMPVSTNLGLWLAGADEFARQAFPGVKAIAMEQPWLGVDYYPARKLISLLGHLHYWSRFYGVGSVDEWPVATGRLNLSGHGNATAEMMIAAALERYGLVCNEHEAHALGIFDVHVFGRKESGVKRRTRSGPGRSVKL